VLALGPLLKKSAANDKETDKFQTKVAADQKALGVVLEQRMRQA
jgi:hypothetical protein